MVGVFTHAVHEKHELNGKEIFLRLAAGFQEEADAQKYVEEKNKEAAKHNGPIKITFYSECTGKDGYNKIEAIKREQAEIDRRTRIEKEAEHLISQCRMQEAIELLNTL